MRRPLTSLIAFVLILVSAFAAGSASPAIAQGSDTAPGHPLVGTWIVTDLSSPNEQFLAIFTADGIYQQHEYDGSSGFGAWEATGPNTANLTFVSQYPDDAGAFGGSSKIRASIMVSADGLSLSASYTIEFQDSTGTDTGALTPAVVNADYTANFVAFAAGASGQFGPGSVTGIRMLVEPMGQPVAPLED